MRSLFIALMMMWANVVFASKSDTAFFDKDWKLCSKEQAAFFRPKPKPDKDKGNYKVVDYFISGTKQMVGYFDSTDEFMTNGDISDQYQNGYFIFYYPNGNVDDEGPYKKGERHGLWKFSADSTGRVRVECMYSNGMRHGHRKVYHPNGKLNRDELFEDDEFVSGTCYDASGKEVPFFPSEKMPEPTVNIGEFIGQNLKYPKQAIKKKVEGRVVVKFVVDTDGKISNAVVIQGIGAGCDEEALRVINNMPPWKPGMQEGVPVKVYYTLPIAFKLTYK